MIYNMDRLVSKMREHDLSAIVASTKENLRYFTGFEPVVKTLNPYFGQCYAVVTLDDPHSVHIVHSVGEIDQVLDARTKVGRVYPYGTFYRESNEGALLSEEEERLRQLSDLSNSFPSGEIALLHLVQDLGLANCRIGFDEDGMHQSHFDHVIRNLQGVEAIPASKVIRSVRSVKTAKEVDALTYSARCIENAIDHVVANLFEGMSEYEIANIFSCSIAKQGAIPSLPMIKVGRHAVGGQRRQSHGIKLMPGDLLWFDCDIVCDGYWADIARVFSYKELKPEYQKMDALYQGQLVAMREIKPGMQGKDVFQLTMSAVHEAGFSSYRRHHVGHGIGLEPYEFPILAPHNEDVIEEGMVLSVETPYYEFGIGALHVEDPIHVLHKGNKILTKSNGSMKVVG